MSLSNLNGFTHAVQLCTMYSLMRMSIAFSTRYAECEVGKDQYSVPSTGASNDDSYDVLHAFNKGPRNKHV